VGGTWHLLILSICKVNLLVADLLKSNFKRFVSPQNLHMSTHTRDQQSMTRRRCC